ncbi:hypothetical protein ATANTOWER_004166, partial [Ataeniobius toweri]|nr:hypothetical protein [Ataeniobius toweri]
MRTLKNITLDVKGFSFCVVRRQKLCVGGIWSDYVEGLSVGLEDFLAFRGRLPGVVWIIDLLHNPLRIVWKYLTLFSLVQQKRVSSSSTLTPTTASLLCLLTQDDKCIS